MEKIIQHDPSDSVGYFRAVCFYSTLRDERALGYLRTVFEKGFKMFVFLDCFEATEYVRSLPEGKALIEEYRAKLDDDAEEEVERRLAEVTVEVPFSREGDLCKVGCKVNGLPLHFVFDTGASSVSISTVEATFMLKNGYLSREDAGLFLLPFALGASAVLAVRLARRRRWGALAGQAVPYLMLAAGIHVFGLLNYTHYGVYTLSDFSSGAFADAMGAMSRVATDSDEGMLSVPADARQKLYDAVPALQPLAYWLEEDPQMINDFRDPELEDYRAGSFYWASRRAAQFEGIYDSAAGAEAYWAEVASAVNAACDDGTLPTRPGDSGARSGTTQPIRARYVLPTLREALRSLGWVLTFQDCAPYESLRSIGTEEDFAAWSGYLHCGFNGAAEAGRDTPYYSPQQKLVFGVLGAVRWVWAFALPVAFVLAAVRMLRLLIARGGVRRGWAAGLGGWLLLAALLFMAALRCGMIAFVEVSSFGIGTSTMYLATVHPLLLLVSFGALAGTFGTSGKGGGGHAEE